MIETGNDGLGRRTLLKRMASVAGAAPVASSLFGADTAAQTSAAAAHDDRKTNRETERLAEHAAKLSFEDLPGAVVQRAKDCICDSVAAIVFGAELPWSKMIIAYARNNSALGRSGILGTGGSLVQAGAAALANGAMTHAFELDNLTKPDSGSHPGATVFTAALAVAQEEHGWLSPELMQFVADYLSMPPVAVQEVATFYTMYELKPVGKHKITLCTNLPCQLGPDGGSDSTAEYLRQKLGIDFGETTPDGKFTLKEGECFGACGDAPVVLVNNHRMCSFMSREKIDQLIEELSK